MNTTESTYCVVDSDPAAMIEVCLHGILQHLEGREFDLAKDAVRQASALNRLGQCGLEDKICIVLESIWMDEMQEMISDDVVVGATVVVVDVDPVQIVDCLVEVFEHIENGMFDLAKDAVRQASALNRLGQCGMEALIGNVQANIILQEASWQPTDEDSHLDGVEICSSAASGWGIDLPLVPLASNPPMNADELNLVVHGQRDTALFNYRQRTGVMNTREIPGLAAALVLAQARGCEREQVAVVG